MTARPPAPVDEHRKSQEQQEQKGQAQRRVAKTKPNEHQALGSNESRNYGS
jgi:hypothetical protein